MKPGDGGIGYDVIFKNVCSYPLQVSVSRFTHARPQIKHLDINESVNIFSDVCPDKRGLFTRAATVSPIKELREQCLPYYELKLGTNENQRTLNVEQFLKVLERSELVSLADYTAYNWTISDPSLCPK
jgi:hypothetical protein